MNILYYDKTEVNSAHFVCLIRQQYIDTLTTVEILSNIYQTDNEESTKIPFKITRL